MFYLFFLIGYILLIYLIIEKRLDDIESTLTTLSTPQPSTTTIGELTMTNI